MAWRYRRALLFGSVAAFSVVGPVLACSSFSDEATSPDAGSAPDAALEAADASPEAAIDSAPATPFCEGRREAGLCADFDQGNPVTFHFLGSGGDIRVDDASFVSPPAAMRAVVVATEQAYVRGQVTGGAYASIQRLSFDTFQGALDGDGGVTTDAVLSSMGRTAGGCTFDLESFGTHARLNVAYPDGSGGVMYENLELAAFPPARQWSHVEVLLQQQGAAVDATVTVDGVVALGKRPTRCGALLADPHLHLGLIQVTKATHEGEARYDNVLFDSK